MKHWLTVFCILLTALTCPLRSASNTFIDYQNYNHGYCPECNCYPCKCGEAHAEEAPCATCPNGTPPAPNPVPNNPPVCSTCKKPDPCEPAPVCAVNCGICLFWIGLAIAGVAAAAAIIISSNNGSTAH